MRKFLKVLPFKKVFVFLFVSLYTLLPSLQAVGVVIEDYASEDVSVGVDEGVSDLEEIASLEVLEEEIPESSYEDGVYTVNSVLVGEEYVYPDDEGVRVRFTSVTEEGDLVISKVELTEEEKELLNTSDDYGWDISSSMSNGSFSYDLTLPNNTESDNVEVKYTEDGNTYESIDDVEVNEGVIYIEGLEHFTIFVVVDPEKGNDDGTVKCTVAEIEGVCYKTIQAAIDAATSEDTIIKVSDGEYSEDININKSGITVESIFGSSATTIKGSVLITASSVTLKGFSINNENGERAVWIQDGSDNVTIAENIFISSLRGIQGNWPGNGLSNLAITGNTFETSYGIAGTENFTNLTITGNTFNTTDEGIGIGEDVTFATGTTFSDLFLDNTFEISGGIAVGDYRVGTLMPTKYTSKGNLLVQEGDSIQDVINKANPGDTVFVNEGTYIVPEGVVINKKDLTLKAVGEVIVKYSADETEESPYGLIGISVLANMGTVTVEGFTVTGYENGIAQSRSQSAATAFHVLNNTVYPGYKDGGPYMRNGIQVTGIGSRVIGNTAIGAPLTEDWSGTAIHVLNSNDVIVENNTITDSFYDIGIGIMNYNSVVDVKNITVRNNSITNAQEAFRISANIGTDLVSDITFENNTISGPEDVSEWVYGLNIQKVKTHNILLKDNNITWNSSQTKEIEISSTATASNIIIDDGLITGTMIPDDNGAINTELDYAGITDGLTLVAQITGQVGNFTHFSGTISGLIDATVTGSINANGYDSLSAVLTIEGITYPVRFLGDFVQAGSTGGLTGRIVTGDYGPYAESIEIETPKTIIGVGETLQLSVTPNIEVAWTVYVNDQEIGSVDETGLVTGLQGGTFIVIAVAQDGSLLDDTIAITVDDTSPTILDTKMFVDKNGSWQETSLTKSGDEVRVLIEVKDDLTEVEKVQIWVREFPWSPNHNELISGNMTKVDNTHFEFIYTVPDTYKDGDPINEAFEGNYFNFRPYDILGNSHIGWRKNFTIDNTAPNVPTGMYFIDKGSTEIKNCGDYTNSEYGSLIHWNENTEGDFLRYEYISYNADGSTGPIREFTTNKFDATWWKSPMDGQYGFQLRAVDNAGNKSNWSSVCNVNVDWVDPTGSIDGIKYPNGTVQDKFVTNLNTPVLVGTQEDDNGVKSVQVKIDDYLSTSGAGGPGFWEVGFSNPIPDGTHTIELTIEDLAGNITTVTKDITIDTVAPFATHTYFKNGTEITDDIAYVQGVNELTFTGLYTDPTPSSGLYWDSFVIFQAQDDGSFRFSANGKKSYCSWRKSPNLVTQLTGSEYSLTDKIPFTNCIDSLPDGEYYMAHQVYDSATRWNIPSINQYRDVLGLHFVVDTQAPESNINIIGNLAETKNLNHNNGWHGDGWYYNFAEVKLDITTGSVLDPNEKIQYQILDDNVTCPTTLNNPTEITSGTNIALVVNSLQDGIHTLCYQAKDSAGNLESVKKEVLKLDRTQPKYEILTHTINGNEVNDVYYISSDTINVDVHGEDNHSGYFRTRYDLFNADESWNCSNRMRNGVDLPDAVNDETQTLSLSGLDDGRYCMQIWIYDDVQNQSRTDKNGLSIIHFVIDNIAPTVDLQLNVNESGFKAVFSEDVNATDAENPANYFLNNWPTAGGSGDLLGDAEISYDSETYTATITFTNSGWYISPEQQWGVQNIHDLAGNILAEPYTEYSTPMIPPVTTVSGIDADWHSTDVTVTLTCTDTGGSGCYKTYYSLDGGTTYQEGNTVIVSTEGENIIIFYSEDSAGNIETGKESEPVKIDKTQPVITLGTYNSTDWTNQDIVVTASTNEGTLNTTSHTFTENGSFDFIATDKAGNITTETVIITNIDKTPPTISPNISNDGVLTVTSSDTLSGIKSVEVQINNGEWETYTSEMNLYELVSNVPGTYTVSVKVTDNAGNVQEANDSFIIPSPTPATTDTGEDILGTKDKSPLKPTPVTASNPPLGTGGYTLAQTDEQDTDEEEITEEETTTQDAPEVKGEEDNEEQNGEEEPTEEQPTKWWVYPLVILPVLAIFLILWKRRKEDNEPQF